MFKRVFQVYGAVAGPLQFWHMMFLCTQGELSLLLKQEEGGQQVSELMGGKRSKVVPVSFLHVISSSSHTVALLKQTKKNESESANISIVSTQQGGVLKVADRMPGQR